MARWARFIGGATSGAAAIASFVGCDLHLRPYVEQFDSGPPIGQPSGGGNAGADVDAAKSNASDAGSKGAKRVFVTSAKFEGALDGVAGANMKCNEVANAAKLGGRFMAWISVDNDSALARLQGDGPWLLVDGRTEIFPNKASIVAPGPAKPIDRDEKGDRVEAELVWTGTRANGQVAGELLTSCGDFTIPAGTALAGTTERDDEDWTQSATPKCNTANRLYCFEL